MNKQGRTALVLGLTVLVLIILALLGYSVYALLNSEQPKAKGLIPLSGDVVLDEGAANKIVATSGVRIISSDNNDDDDDDDGTSTDTTAPNPITNLNLVTKGTNFIYWTWTNPNNTDFSQNLIYINGANVAASSHNYYNATGLAANTTYTITVNTRDTNSNVNRNNVSDTQRTLAVPANSSDTTPPASITNLLVRLPAGRGTNFINWEWTNPADADFYQNIVYINGVNVANSSNSYYNSTGLSADTFYVITVHTKDINGNVNNANVSLGTRTDAVISPDTTPPASISGLTAGTKGTNFINWAWTNPADADFSFNLIYINGVNVANSTNAFYNATGLSASTAYTITVHTIDASGNINNLDVSSSATTNAVGINTAPVLGLPASLILAEDSTQTLNLSNYVTDAEDADSTITWTFSGNSNIAVSIDSNKIATFTPAANWNGNEFITFRAADPSGASASAILPVSVTPVDDSASWLSALSDKSVNEDLKANKDAAVQASTVLYPNIMGLCSDVDSTKVISVVSTSSNFNLAIVGNDLVLSGLRANWYTLAGQGESIILSCNGATASFKLNVNQLLDECSPPICSYGHCEVYCD